MAIRDEDIISITTKPMNRSESMYLPEVFKGFGTTMRHFFTSVRAGQDEPDDPVPRAASRALRRS
jgi:hypothetical protein